MAPLGLKRREQSHPQLGRERLQTQGCRGQSQARAGAGEPPLQGRGVALTGMGTGAARPRQTLAVTPLDATIVAALEDAALRTEEPYMRMHSGAAHDTMCVAERVPSAMVFVPCVEGISHHPDEDAEPADAALAAEIILNAIRTLA